MQSSGNLVPGISAIFVNKEGFWMELFSNICRQCGLGEPVSQPFPLNGGFLHKMYGLTTDQGKFALKLLNPHIMGRETAKENFETAERLEGILEREGLPILPALTIGGKKMQQAEGQFFYLFPWYDGKSVQGGEIQPRHCAEMGRALAQIHRVSRKDSGGEGAPVSVEWFSLGKALKEVDGELSQRLGERLPLLCQFQERSSCALRRIPVFSAICHNDMDPKNVLWIGMEYRIIDLECLSYSNPLAELLETALCWAGFDGMDFSPEKLRAFLDAYAEQDEAMLKDVDWESLYDGSTGRLSWLEYNLKRALGIESGESEREIGKAEALRELERIAYYVEMRETVLKAIAHSAY